MTIVGFALFKIIAFVVFVLSSGLIFHKHFRENYLAIGIAGIIALVSSYFVFESLWERFQTVIESTIANRIERIRPSGRNPASNSSIPSSQTVVTGLLTLQREAALKPMDVFKECDSCPEMVVIPAGSFTMGSPHDEIGEGVGPQHKVNLTRQFAVGRFAVTFDEWDACTSGGGCNGYKPSDHNWGRGRRPVIDVNWNDAKAYLAWLSRKTGKTYRLLSEAEREYVTRAGTTTAYWWGSSVSTDQANYNSHRGQTVPVDSFNPNPWGLYQVHGNTWDYVEDCWHDDYKGAPADGSAWTSSGCDSRVLRGGSWLNPPVSLRSDHHAIGSASDRSYVHGFRVARTFAP